MPHQLRIRVLFACFLRAVGRLAGKGPAAGARHTLTRSDARCAWHHHYAVLASLVAVVHGTPLYAQQRPLTVEDPETIGNGRVLVEAGIGHESSVELPIYGLEGDIQRLPSIGLSFGLGSIAEFQLDSGYTRMHVTSRGPGPLASALTFSGDSTGAVEDVVVGTKIKIVPETAGRPGFGVRFATKLPNASTESGLGTDMTDFAMTLLIGKTVESVRVVGNVGFAILGDPTRLATQHDPLLYGLSLARAVKPGLEVVGELAGRWLPSQSDAPAAENRSALRAGIRYTYKTVRVDGGAIMGLTDIDPTPGFTVGVTWVFDAFKTP